MGNLKQDLEFFNQIDDIDKEEVELQQFQDEQGIFRNVRNIEKRQDGSLLSTFEKTARNLRSSENALVRGLIEGVGGLGRSFGPLPQTQEETQSIEDTLRQFLPTQEGFTEKTLERGGKLFPLVATGGASGQEAVVRSLLASLAGQTTEEFGGGPIPQLAAETLALTGPSLGRRIQGRNPEQQRQIDFARQQGLTEEQIAPLLQDESGFKNFLARISPKGGRTRRALETAREGQGQLFESLNRDPATQEILNNVERTELTNGINRQMRNLSNRNRGRINNDLEDLINSNGSIEDLVNFWRDINSEFRGERDILQTLKEPVLRALRDKNPAFAEKFELTNDLASRYFSINRRLRATPITEGIEIVSSLRAIPQAFIGLVTGNLGLIGELVGETAARQISREMLTNPRFQNLSRQVITAARANKRAVVGNIYSQMIRQLQKQGLDQETIDKFQDITQDELDEFIESFKPIKEEKKNA